MLLKKQRKLLLVQFLSKRTISIIKHKINNKRLMRLMPCIARTLKPFGLFLSFLLSHKYSLICLNTPIKNIIRNPYIFFETGQYCTRP